VPIDKHFDLEIIQRELPALKVYFAPQSSSTNDMAWQLIVDREGEQAHEPLKQASFNARNVRKGDREPAHPHLPSHPTSFITLTDHQTGGRGQQGRQWWSGPGSLTFSMSIWQASHSEPTSLLPMVTALAVIDEIARIGVSRPLKLKWPNDVLLRGKKISGILIESKTVGKLRWFVIGIGVNANNSMVSAPREIRLSSTSLIDERGSTIDRDQLLIRICQEFARGWLLAGRSQQTILQRSLDASFFSLGSELQVETPSGVTVGEFAGFGSFGQLLLKTGDLTNFISSGRIISPRN